MNAPDTLSPITEAQRTAYARQLRLGFHGLRFEPALEAIFQAEQEPLLERRIARLATLILVIWMGFLLTDGWRLGGQPLRPEQVHDWQGLRATRWGVASYLALGGLAAAARFFGRLARLWLAIGVLVICQGATLVAVFFLRLGVPPATEAVMLLMAGVFLPIGLTWRQAAALSAGNLMLMTALGLWMLDGQATGRFLFVMFLGLATSLVAGFGAYYREYAQRQQFLLRAELGWQAGHDGLTGLSNRRLFDERLRSLLRQSRREGQALTLLLFDVDWFKRYNDLYGHPAGDAALQLVGELLQGLAARPLDLASRLGGEEMSVLLYGASAEAARGLANQLLERLREVNMTHAGSASGRLSLSVGCTDALPSDTPESLYQRADRLLYQAKQGGRDRVVVG